MTLKDLFQPFLEDIQAVHRCVSTGPYRLLWEDEWGLSGIVDINAFDYSIRPGLVCTVSHLFRGAREQTLVLACLVQLIFLAWRFHGVVSEAGQGREQRTILLGDFCYSRFFALASSSGLARFIRPLAQVVCLMGEGAIARCRPVKAGMNEERLLKSLHRETASLFGEACRCAGDLAGAKPEQQRLLYRFGVALGMGYALVQAALSHLAKAYLIEARSNLAQLPSCRARDVLEGVLDYLVTMPSAQTATCPRGY